MKKVAIVLVVAAAAGYWFYRSSHGPEALYKAFAEEVLHRHYDAAAAMTDSLTAAQLERSGTQEKIGAGPSMFLSVPIHNRIAGARQGRDDYDESHANRVIQSARRRVCDAGVDDCANESDGVDAQSERRLESRIV